MHDAKVFEFGRVAVLAGEDGEVCGTAVRAG